MPRGRAHRCATLLLAGIVFAGLTGAQEGALTIVGSGKGPVTVIEKDGRVTTMDPTSIPLNTSAPKPDSSPPAEASAAPEAAPAGPTQPDEGEQARKAEAARATAAAKAAEDERRAKAKEAANYQDKEYTYGPGSASKVDRTGSVLQEQRQGRSTFRETRAKPQSLRNERPKPPEDTPAPAAGGAPGKGTQNP